MPKNPHDKKDLKKKCEKPFSEQTEESGENGAWSEDQKKRGYYYDDAHGYQVYDADEDESEEK